MTCTAPVVKVTVEEPENEEAANLLERSLGQHLPKILAARALNLEQARVNAAATQAKADLDALRAVKDQPDPPLEEKDKVCLDQKVQIGEESRGAMGILFSAATTAQMATASD
jgi:hypothetical protein